MTLVSDEKSDASVQWFLSIPCRLICLSYLHFSFEGSRLLRMYRISFNVGNEYFSPITGPKAAYSQDEELKTTLHLTHLSFDDEDHLKREFQRVRDERKEIMATVTDDDFHCFKDIEREWWIIRAIKNAYWKVWQKSEEEMESITRRFVFHVGSQCYAFDLHSTESDNLGHHSARFWFLDREDLEQEWTRVREKMMSKWPETTHQKHIRFLEPGWDTEWLIVDGMMKTFLWAESRENEKDETDSGRSSLDDASVEKLATDCCKMKIKSPRREEIEEYDI